MWRCTSSRTDAGSTKRLIRQIHFRCSSWHCQYRFLLKKLSKSVILHIIFFILSLPLSIAYNKSRLKICIKMYWINQDEEYVVGTFMTGFQLWCISKLETSNDHGCKTLKLPSGLIQFNLLRYTFICWKMHKYSNYSSYTFLYCNLVLIIIKEK